MPSLSKLDLALLPKSYVSIWDAPFLEGALAQKVDGWLQSPVAGDSRLLLKSKNTEGFLRAIASEMKMAYDVQDTGVLERLRRLQQEGLRFIGAASPSLSSLGVAWEAWDGFPQTFFFAKSQDRTIVGKRRLSSLFVDGKIKTPFDAGIREPELLGELLSFRTTENRVWIHFKNLPKTERASIFNSIHRIDFPFCLLDPSGLEPRSPREGWDYSPDRQTELVTGEEALVRLSIAALKKFGISSGKVFDPACSTGEYLRSLKEVVPALKTIGQDLSKEMCEAAKSKVDEVMHGDAIHPGVENQSVDLLILRFLNSEVMTTAYAHQVASKVFESLKPGGFIFLFGFTPTLVSAHFFETLGCDLLQSVSYDQESDALYSFSVLTKALTGGNSTESTFLF